MSIYRYIYIDLVIVISSTLSAGAVEYASCISAEGYPPNEYPGYDTKQSDGEVPAMLSTTSLPSLVELTCVGCDGTILTFKQGTYAKLNWLKLNSFGIQTAYLC